MCIIGRSWLGKYSESVLSSHETARVTICPKLTESELPTYGLVVECHDIVDEIMCQDIVDKVL